MTPVQEIIQQRRSIRKYKDTRVPDQINEQILNAGRMAPSAMSLQPWKFYILSEPKMIRDISWEIAAAAEGYFALGHGVHMS